MAEEFLSLYFAFPNPFNADFTAAFDESGGFGTSFLLPEGEYRDVLAMYLMMSI